MTEETKEKIRKANQERFRKMREKKAKKEEKVAIISGDGEVTDDGVLIKNQKVLAEMKASELDEYLEELTEAEKKDYEAEASMIANSKVFQREIKYLFGGQALYIATQSANWDQTLVGRGTINGIALVEERFKLLDSRHKESIKPTEEFDKHGLMPK